MAMGGYLNLHTLASSWMGHINPGNSLMSEVQQDHTQAKRPLIYIAEGCGGVLDFNTIPPQHTSSSGSVAVDVKRVGTTGCWTCVGIYSPLDKDRCFVAHVMAKSFDTEIISAIEGRDLKKVVTNKIRKAVGSQLATPPALKMAQEKVIIICPCPRKERPRSKKTNPNGKALTGHYVAEAVCEFLGLEASESVNHNQGFIVNHYDRHRSPLLIGLDISEEEPDDESEHIKPEQYGYEQVQGRIFDIEQDWDIILEDGEWVDGERAAAAIERNRLYESLACRETRCLVG